MIYKQRRCKIREDLGDNAIPITKNNKTFYEHVQNRTFLYISIGENIFEIYIKGKGWCSAYSIDFDFLS